MVSMIQNNKVLVGPRPLASAPDARMTVQRFTHEVKLGRSGFAVVLLFGSALIVNFLSPSTVRAQADEPLQSPLATVSQVVGLEPITITYHSPGVKERAVWGELVPYGENWRAGANGKTTFTFEEEVVIEGTTLAAGTYGFYIFPASGEEWQLVWNSSSEGSPNEFQQNEDVVRVTVQPEDAPFRERLLYSIENFTDLSPYTAELTLHWEKKRVAVQVTIKAAE